MADQPGDRARREDEGRADLREAYERGRRDARASRRRHPILMTAMTLSALVGLIVLVLAAALGSFSGAGRAVDRSLSIAADRAEPVVRDAAGEARQSLSGAMDETR